MKEIKAYGVIDSEGKLLNDMMGRIGFINKIRAEKVAKEWGVPNNVVELEIIIKKK